MLDLTTLEENDIPHLTVVVRPLTGSVPHASRFEEIFCLTGKGHSQGNAARRQTADGRPSHAMGDGSTSSVAGVLRVTDDDDNDMHIDLKSNLLRRPSH